MKDQSAPAFKVKGFTTGYDPDTGRVALILRVEGNKEPLALIFNPDYARRIGASLVEISGGLDLPPDRQLH